MDFSRQGAGAQQPVRPAGQPVSADPSHAQQFRAKNPRRSGFGLWTRVGYTVLLFATTILVVAIAGLIAFGGNGESKYIDSSKYQAVFINNGSTSGQSVWFGHITKLNNQYLVLQDVFYITQPSTTASTSTSTNYQLTKLGCQQLDAPYDQMVIDQDQVAFWENLQSTGKVVQEIEQFQKDNPNGPDCSQTTTSSTPSTSSTAGTTTTTGSTTGTSTTTGTTSTSPATTK